MSIAPLPTMSASRAVWIRRWDLIECQIDSGKGSCRDDFDSEHGRRLGLSRGLRRNGRSRREPQQGNDGRRNAHDTHRREDSRRGPFVHGENHGGIMGA